MIRKALITSAVLLVSYSVYVAFLAPASWTGSQHEWQDNLIKAENFIYNERDSFEHVILGSSLSYRLSMRDLPEMYNLSFAGHSVLDGIEVILRSGKHVRNVYIETNFPDKPEDVKFIESLFSVLYYPRKYLHALRDDKRPLSIIGTKLSKNLTSRVTDRIQLMTARPGDVDSKSRVFTRELTDIRSHTYAQTPDDSLLVLSLRTLRERISLLEQRGTRVVLFEMPVNQRLIHMANPTLTRTRYLEWFPVARYRHIPLPDSLDYVTTDGIHMNREDAYRYTRYFRDKVFGQQ
jgi:hypothetical protein